jgi:phage baseplate assembly protein W
MKILKNTFIDIPMFFTRNSFTRDLAVRKDTAAIQDALKNIILTIFHERPFDPEFGTNATTSLFENPVDFSFYVENSIATAIQRYEPRVQLLNIKSNFEGRTIYVDLEYKIKQYDVTQDLTLTFNNNFNG